MMKKIQFRINIDAPKNKVYDLMLGISNKLSYEGWAAVFHPTSTYEGNWNKGSKILFIGTDELGNKFGMVSEIIENIPNKFVSICHKGIIQNGQELTTGTDAEKWSGGFENYTFEEKNNNTILIVDLDTPEDYFDYFNETYPKALNKLKEICEKQLNDYNWHK